MPWMKLVMLKELNVFSLPSLIKYELYIHQEVLEQYLNKVSWHTNGYRV